LFGEIKICKIVDQTATHKLPNLNVICAPVAGFGTCQYDVSLRCSCSLFTLRHHNPFMMGGLHTFYIFK